MRREVLIILQSLENKDPSVTAMEGKAMEVIKDNGDFKTFMDRIKDEIKISNRVHVDRQPFYYFYGAVAYLKQGDIEVAKDDLANAVQGFRISGMTFNEALCEWLFSLIHFENKKITRSKQARDTAIILFERIINECEENSFYNRANKYKKIRKELGRLSRDIQVSIRKNKSRTDNTGYPLLQIRLPWLSIHDSVRAGPNGMIWADPLPKSGILVDLMEIQGKTYRLHPINPASSGVDVKISLTKETDYGLSMVRGNSMNASKPVPINEGDFVLFSSKQTKGKDAIVIAGYITSAGVYSTMVKRYVAGDKLLISETSDESADHPPIELTDDYKILGTVLAVAKPSS